LRRKPFSTPADRSSVRRVGTLAVERAAPSVEPPSIVHEREHGRHRFAHAGEQRALLLHGLADNRPTGRRERRRGDGVEQDRHAAAAGLVARASARAFDGLRDHALVIELLHRPSDPVREPGLRVAVLLCERDHDDPAAGRAVLDPHALGRRIAAAPTASP
jgi:hypothetical protein